MDFSFIIDTFNGENLLSVKVFQLPDKSNPVAVGSSSAFTVAKGGSFGGRIQAKVEPAKGRYTLAISALKYVDEATYEITATFYESTAEVRVLRKTIDLKVQGNINYYFHGGVYPSRIFPASLFHASLPSC